MMRTGDIPSPRYHSTYSNKPLPLNQLQSQMAPFTAAELQDSNHKQQATVFDASPLPVPTTYDTYYDPNHPDADWAGLVLAANGHKKHALNHASQVSQLSQSENGIVSNQREKYEYHKKRLNPPGSLDQENVDGRVIGGLKSRDPYITTYQEFIDKKKPNHSNDTEKDKQSSSPTYCIHSSVDDSKAAAAVTSDEYHSYLNRYTSQRTLSKSLISNMGQALQNEFK